MLTSCVMCASRSLLEGLPATSCTALISLCFSCNSLIVIVGRIEGEENEREIAIRRGDDRKYNSIHLYMVRSISESA